MAAATTDGAYVNLLNHLQKPRSSISLETVLAASTHYLGQLQLPHPTQLTAFIISSQVWGPISINHIQLLSETYRSALYVKQNVLLKESMGWFSPSPPARLGEWVGAILKGVSRGRPLLRVAILGGLIMGLDEIDKENIPLWMKETIEKQLVIACAEALEAVTAKQNNWHSEFTLGKELADEILFLYCAYTFLPLVSDDKFSVLDIKSLCQFAERGVNQAFDSGKFLSSLSPSLEVTKEGRVSISTNSPLKKSLDTLKNNVLYQNAGSLAKLLSRCISILGDKFPRDAWRTFRSISGNMEAVSKSVEADWDASDLSRLHGEDNIEPVSRPIATDVWKALKTLLFAQVMISQAILVHMRYIRPSLYPDELELRPSSIARSILRSLHHVSFIIFQFGSIVSGAGFKELKRTFYMAIDIMEAGLEQEATNRFTIDLVTHTKESDLSSEHPSKQAQTAFTLAIIEQLVPVLTDPVIENDVVPFCEPYLDEPDYREVYESAHSVMLSIFAASAQRRDSLESSETPALAEKLVPFYVGSLIKNSNENRLNVSQLRLAYSNLVRSAASSGDDALPWLCIDMLLSHTKSAELSSRMPLHLTLVSLISCVGQRLLSKVMMEIKVVYENADAQIRQELQDAIVQEIMNRTGEMEKEIVLTWWQEIASVGDTSDAAQ